MQDKPILGFRKHKQADRQHARGNERAAADQGGIRHAEGMFESNVTFEEAKFMLVSCSAFINYMIAEYGKRTD